MIQYPEVHFVILNYNSSEDTIECLQHLEKITYPNFKVVIVDNASTDQSVMKLRPFCENHTLIESKRNLGYANGNNIGIKFALQESAAYICILNSDVEVEPDFLQPIIDMMGKDAKIGLCGPCICEYKEREKVQAMGANINLFTGLTQRKHKGKDYASIEMEAVEVDYLGGACFVAKAEVFHRVGFIPENYFLFFEETEFCLRVKRQRYKILCYTGSRVYHKGSATISKYGGLSYFLLNYNRIVFMRRNANAIHKAVFAVYLPIEGIGRILLRKEPVALFKHYIAGLRADKEHIDLDSVKGYLK